MDKTYTAMRVLKRSGEFEEVSFDKVKVRIKNHCDSLSIDPIVIAQKVCSQIYDGVKTSDLDELSAQICVSMATESLDYSTLAARIIISNNHKNTSPSFSETMYVLHKNKDKHGKSCPLIADDVYSIIMENKEKLNSVLDYSRDYSFDYFGYKTLEKSYLLKVNDTVIERIQHMFLRVSIGLHKEDLKSAIRSYEFMSKKYFTHATPTLFNAATNQPQLMSCFLLGTEDSISGIYKTLSDCAKISKWAGGIGVHISNIRSRGSVIRGTNGKSTGIIPMLKVYNETAKYVNQGGKRNGSIAIYLEPHHPDVLDFMELRKNHGNEDDRARDLFLALWVSDLFMERVEANADWSLFDPDMCPMLNETYGSEYRNLYLKYEEEGKAVTTIPAQKIWRAMLTSQIETGTPYVMFKDHVNEQSMQKNIGIIKSSNLCVAPETKILTDNGYFAICELEGQSVNVWNGVEFSKTTVMKTGENQKLIKVELSNGAVIECTEYHKFYLKDGYEIEAASLRAGYMLQSFKLPDSDLIERHSVKSVKDIGRYSDTYCFNEPKRHMGIFNGILTGNCSEIVQYSSAEEYACCCLASIVLPSYVDKESKTFDHEKLIEVCKTIVWNLNKVLDLNYYPVPETQKSAFKHRTLGIGVQGLADVFMMMKLPFESEGAKKLNAEIFETIYYGCMKASNEVAIKRAEYIEKMLDAERVGDQATYDAILHKIGNYTDDEQKLKYAIGAYSTFEGSPMSKGIFHFDHYGTKAAMYDWDDLRDSIMKYGVRNSMVCALMPTASTSIIMGSNECFEPITSNIYTRRTIAGDFVVINKHLVEDMTALGLWNKDIKDMIIANDGSIQAIEGIPSKIKEIYKTVWEIRQREVINHAIGRSPFVDQASSMNLYMTSDENESKVFVKLSSALIYAWKNGIKNGVYYTRTRPATTAQKFTLDYNMQKKLKEEKKGDDSKTDAEKVAAFCTRDNPDCAMCSA